MTIRNKMRLQNHSCVSSHEEKNLQKWQQQCKNPFEMWCECYTWQVSAKNALTLAKFDSPSTINHIHFERHFIVNVNSINWNRRQHKTWTPFRVQLQYAFLLLQPRPFQFHFESKTKRNVANTISIIFMKKKKKDRGTKKCSESICLANSRNAFDCACVSVDMSQGFRVDMRRVCCVQFPVYARVPLCTSVCLLWLFIVMKSVFKVYLNVEINIRTLKSPYTRRNHHTNVETDTDTATES